MCFTIDDENHDIPLFSDNADDRLDYSNVSSNDDLKSEIIQRVVNEKMPQSFAGKQLGVSVRQIQRMVATYRLKGKEGLRHQLIGRPSNNSRLTPVKQEVLTLIRNVYPGAGPTLGSEMLMTRHNIRVSAETLRGWLIADGIWEPGHRHMTLRRRRQRKPCLGEMARMDTSMHRWLDNLDHDLYLIASKDDATSTVFARFYEADSTATNMDFMKRYIMAFGRPLSFYLDRASHFKHNVPRKENQAEHKEFTTQIQRAMGELDIEIKFARSPEGKGRIEREFRTLQDRLLKLMRWDNVRSLEEANAYLETFLPKHNERFMVEPAHAWNLHRPGKGFDLDAIFSVQVIRKVSNDNVVRFDNVHYQLLVDKDDTNLRGKWITVEQRLNGNIKFRYAGKYYNYRIKPY
jgi:transposase